MRIFIAGATGTLGLPLVRRLVAQGHHVTGLGRRPEKAELLRSAGAIPVFADALDAGSLKRTVAAARPEAIYNLLTALPPGGARRDADLHLTNRLRTEGAANIVAAAEGVGRLIAESFVLVYGFGDHGREPLTEESPLRGRGNVPPRRWAVVDALRTLEDRTRAAGGVVLRFGMLRGPGVPSVVEMEEAIRRRKIPVVGTGDALGSWVELGDAVEALVVALNRGEKGQVYNIVSGRPEAWRDVLESSARRLGAAPPRRVPAWLARFLAPLPAALVTTSLPVSANRARKELGWQPADALDRS